MNRKAICLPILLLILLISSCRRAPEKTDWSVTLNKEHKEPYGTWLAYESLPGYFPNARTEYLNKWFRYDHITDAMRYHHDSAALLVMAGLNCYVSNAEWDHLVAFARTGNEIVIFCSQLDSKMVHAFHCEKESHGPDEDYGLNQLYDGAINQHTLQLSRDTANRYGFVGRTLQSSFDIDTAEADTTKPITDSADIKSYYQRHHGRRYGSDEYDASADADYSSIISRQPEILGYGPDGPNFIRYRVGHGHISLHAAPLALSNYFLLQPGNRKYLDGIWHTLPENIAAVYWSEYYKRTSTASHASLLWKYASTRNAIITGAFALLLYVLLGLKRRQRIVPVILPVGNASVSFVETVGRLYFNKGNHSNLAEKMIQHFLEWVRTYYYLDTGQMSDAFVSQLIAKSGRSEGEVRSLVNRINDVRLGAAISDQYLHDLYLSIQSFYNGRQG